MFILYLARILTSLLLFFNLVAQGNIDMVVIEQEEEVVDKLVLEEAAAEATRQKTGSSHAAGDANDLSELFGDFEGEVEPVAETRASKRVRVTIVVTSESESEE